MQVFYRDQLRGRLHGAREHLQGTGWIDFITQEAERKGESRVFAKQRNRVVPKYELIRGSASSIEEFMGIELRLLNEDDAETTHDFYRDEMIISWTTLNPQTPLEFEAIFDSWSFESYD